MQEQVQGSNQKSARKIGFIGVPGSGKSTVAQAVQVEMGRLDCLTAVCPEYAREFINKVGPPEHVSIQQGILFKQLNREDNLAQSCDVLFCDSLIYFSYIYGLLITDRDSLQQIKVLRNIYKWAVLDHLKRYDIIFYLPRQFDIVDDGCRAPEFNDTIEEAILGFIGLHKHLFPNFIEIRSELSDPQEILHDRVKQIKRHVNGHLKKLTA